MLKKRSTFFKESLTLIVSNLTTGVCAFTFSILISNKLGAEGMGLYGLIMPIYDLFTCLINGGMTAAISRNCAIYFGKNDFGNLHKTVESTLTFDAIWAIIVACFVFINSSYISSNIIKDARSLRALRVICPAMIFIALSAILKGYFYSISTSKVPAIIDIVEKGLRIVVFSLIIYSFNISSVSGTVTTAYTTLAVGELVSLIFLYFFYIKNKLKFKFSYNKSEDSLQLLFNVLIVSLPLCLNGFLTTGLYTLSTLIIPRRLISAGINYREALSLMGKFSNMALSIPLFPSIILTSICTILIPDLSESMSKGNYFSMENRIEKIIKIALILSLSTLSICAAIPNELGLMFFNRTDLGNYIRFLSFSTPFAYVSIISYAILNGIGKQKILLRNSIIVAIEDLIFLYILTGLSFINIYGYGITLIITSITSIVLNFKEIKKHCFIKIDLHEKFIYALCTILVYLILNLLNNIILIQNIYIKNILIIFSGFSLMFILINITNKKH
ncbi:stage V sporulation protein B [Clostridium botulinum]|nr:stage V sporulation protein B [Clostridium botulinum]APC85037.1 stage V sporulation protein B [Clostridium botulinum]AXG95165.1 stage V sporulation protein B [Clostridium botulinum]EDT81044.1 polysaccharide biosynthesis family protein [Clostridium botulinum NCTC 2916]MBY6770297.1 stage V sporulation protein B [Clostridium botulinum]MBY6776025.1 stage V sporulation protein B [Clostridium botulinum]